MMTRPSTPRMKGQRTMVFRVERNLLGAVGFRGRRGGTMRNAILAITLGGLAALAAPRQAAAQVSLHFDQPGFSLHAGRPPVVYGPPVALGPPVVYGPPVYYRGYDKHYWKHWKKHRGWGHYKHHHHHHGDWDDD